MVAWDDDGSSTAPKASGTAPGDDVSEELEEEGETLGHSSKSLHPTSLRDWSENDDDELEPPAALGATALHVAIASTT
jgi:hypothetical protein